MKGRAIYREKRYQCGEYMTVYVYPVVPCGKSTPGKRTRKKASREVQKKLNRRHAAEHLERVAHANFTDDDLSITLTFTENPKTKEEAAKKIQAFLRKLRRLYKKANIEMKYIWKMERSKKGRYHVHMILSGGIDRDTIEGKWGLGYANTKRLQFDQNGITALARYITKSHTDKEEEQLTYRSYNGSKNLIDPEPEISDTRVRSKRKAAELADMNQNTWMQLYPEYELTDLSQFHDDGYGGIYLFARLFRTDGKRVFSRKRKE